MIRGPLLSTLASVAVVLLTSSCYADPGLRRQTLETGNFNEDITSGFARDINDMAIRATATTTSLENTDKYIVGGTQVVDPSLYPWYVRLNNDCGGAMIWPGIVATVANCIYSGGIKTGQVGGVKVSDGLILDVKDAFYHPGFVSAFPGTNDIGIVVLDLKSDTDLSGITMATINKDPNQPAAGAGLAFVGFGTTETNQFNTDMQRLSNYEAMSDSECFVFWKGLNPRGDGTNIDPKLQFCATTHNNVTGGCDGDFGGPIFNSENVIMGFYADRANRTCATDQPELFTRASAYYEWLYAAVCNTAQKPPKYCFKKPNPCGFKLFSAIKSIKETMHSWYGGGKQRHDGNSTRF